MTEQTSPTPPRESDDPQKPPSPSEPVAAAEVPQLPSEHPAIPQQAGSPQVSSEPSVVPQQPRPGLPRWVPWSFAALAAVIIVLGIVAVTALTGADNAQPETTASAAAAAPTPTRTAPEVPPPPPVTYYTPTKNDFKLEVKILKKQCFGSAGCNITYRIGVTYLGEELDPHKTYEVTYEVKGAEDPIVNTLEVTGDSASVQQEETSGTKRSSDKLTAIVTEVSEL